MRVTLVHDYLTQRGGAERVVLAMARAFPGARILTSLFDPAATYPEFSDLEIVPSSLNRFSVFRRDARRAAPLLARTFERWQVDDADVVLCSSSGWAHRISSAAPKVVYCHNVARWLYQPDDYFGAAAPVARAALQLVGPPLRRADANAAASADTYLANSSVVRRRLREAYGIDAQILAPPVALSPSGPKDVVPDLPERFFLTVARARGYKNTKRVVAAFERLPREHLVVVGGKATVHGAHLPDNVTVLDRVSDRELRWLYTTSRAIICAAREDFGLTPLEANALGTPALTVKAGGFLDTMNPGTSGYFLSGGDADGIAAGVVRVLDEPIKPHVLRLHASRYSEAAFAYTLRGVLREVAAAGGSSESQQARE